MERYLGDPVLSQFRGLYYFSNLRSKLTRDWLSMNGNPRSARCDTCSQSYIVPHRRHSNSAKLSSRSSTTELRMSKQRKNTGCASKHTTKIVNRETAYGFTSNLWPYRKSWYRTDKSDEQDSSSSESSGDSGPSPADRNNTMLERNNCSPPPERETLTEPEMGGSIFDSTTISTTSNQEHSDVLVPGVDYIGRRGNEVNCGKWWANTPSSRHKLRKPIFAYQQYQRYYLCQR